MNYKFLVNAIVICCMLIGAALMMYADSKHTDTDHVQIEQIKTDKELNLSKGTCKKSVQTIKS